MQPSLQRGGCPSLSNNVQVFFLSCIKKREKKKERKKVFISYPEMWESLHKECKLHTPFWNQIVGQ